MQIEEEEEERKEHESLIFCMCSVHARVISSGSRRFDISASFQQKSAVDQCSNNKKEK